MKDADADDDLALKAEVKQTVQQKWNSGWSQGKGNSQHFSGREFGTHFFGQDEIRQQSRDQKHRIHVFLVQWLHETSIGHQKKTEPVET